jgi:hypothetical protein
MKVRGMRVPVSGAAAIAALYMSLSTASAADAGCNRECLAGFMTTYLTALVKHDAASLPATRNIKYTENGVRLTLGDGLWQTASAMPTYRVDVIDESTGQVGLLGRISENGNINWYAVRLKVEMGKQISQIEVLVNRSISAAPAAPGAAPRAAPTEPNPLMMQPIPVNRRDSRTVLAAAGNAYFTGLDTEDSGRNVPFSPDCQRRENGGIMANNPDAPPDSMQHLGCKAQFDTGFSVIVTAIRERRFDIVDPVTGLAFGWGYFDHNGSVAKFTNRINGPLVDVAPTFRQPITFYIAEVFKVVDGNIRQIEAVLTTVPYQVESGW